MAWPIHPTFVLDPDTINYVMKGPSQHEVTRELIIAFNRDVEGKIRAALIEMGWTPPATEPVAEQD